VLLYLLLLGCGVVDQLTPRPRPPAPISVEFRLVDESPASDAPAHSIKGSDEQVRLEQTAVIDRADIESAEAQQNSATGTYDVLITFSPAGAGKLRTVTAQHIGRRLAIVIDGVVISAPKIQAEIPGGVAVVSGNFTIQEARDIAERLNSIAP
jgi:SecD/SecF fusion protein